jgi:tryptophan synthase alpha chain
MGYANPIEAMGVEAFAAAAGSAGVDGVLVVDYPPEEGIEFARALQRHALDPIFLLAPTSSDARIAQVGALASGYIYYVSLEGRHRIGGARRRCRCRAHSGNPGAHRGAGGRRFRHS